MTRKRVAVGLADKLQLLRLLFEAETVDVQLRVSAGHILLLGVDRPDISSTSTVHEDDDGAEGSPIVLDEALVRALRGGRRGGGLDYVG